MATDTCYNSISTFSRLLTSEEWSSPSNKLMYTSFKAVEEVLNAHSGMLRQFEELIAKMVSREDMVATLALKANVRDVKHSMERLGDALEEKVSVSELDAILKEFNPSEPNHIREDSQFGGKIQEIQDYVEMIKNETTGKFEIFATKGDLARIKVQRFP